MVESGKARIEKVSIPGPEAGKLPRPPNTDRAGVERYQWEWWQTADAGDHRRQAACRFVYAADIGVRWTSPACR